ncbi:MAG: hypothetical protein WD055_00185 [Candidatus Dependentiae bacterium]
MRNSFIFCILAIINNLYAAEQSVQSKSAALKGKFHLIDQIENAMLCCLVQIDHDSEVKIINSWTRGFLQQQLHLSIPMHYFMFRSTSEDDKETVNLMEYDDVLILEDVSLGKADVDDDEYPLRIDAQLTCKIKDIDKLVFNALPKDTQKKVGQDQLKRLRKNENNQ